MKPALHPKFAKRWCGPPVYSRRAFFWTTVPFLRRGGGRRRSGRSDEPRSEQSARRPAGLVRWPVGRTLDRDATMVNNARAACSGFDYAMASTHRVTRAHEIRSFGSDCCFAARVVGCCGRAVGAAIRVALRRNVLCEQCSLGERGAPIGWRRVGAGRCSAAETTGPLLVAAGIVGVAERRPKRAVDQHGAPYRAGNRGARRRRGALRHGHGASGRKVELVGDRRQRGNYEQMTKNRIPAWVMTPVRVCQRARFGGRRQRPSRRRRAPAAGGHSCS